MHRRFLAVVAGVVASIAFSSVALANECVNASKQPEAGAQAIINFVTGEVEVLTEGLQRRIDQGQVDLATGAGFHGLVRLRLQRRWNCRGHQLDRAGRMTTSRSWPSSTVPHATA